MPKTYIGRFAPSPTGWLHIGSLLTAVASYLDARSHQGKWLVRMEDLDPLREQRGAASAILSTLEAFALYWDDTVVYQSQRHHLYQQALSRLQANNQVYRCYCSRKTVQAEARGEGIDAMVYGGRCSLLPSDWQSESGKKPAWRVRSPSKKITFIDTIQGLREQQLDEEVGDFVLLRADGFWAYQLAVVVDDAVQGITHVVRGEDLLSSTPRQIYLQSLLNLPQPCYAHVPLLTNKLGQKWSKQTCAPVLNLNQREQLMRQVFNYLQLPQAPAVDHIADLLQWGVEHWQLEKVAPEPINTETEYLSNLSH